jgi:CheY-like chemotaxis protein
MAGNAKEADEYADKNRGYDFYFISKSLPDSDGIELARQLRTRKNFSGHTVIMGTPADWNEVEEDEREAVKFLPNPIFPSDVLNIITESLFGKIIKTAENADGTERYPGRRILLAEDMEINREVVIALLEPAELDIECASNGIEAVEMYKKSPEKYDMIFMDVQMPDMDGYEATRLIRCLESERAKTVPIVAMTANVFREDIDKCIEAGMSDHVGKPLDIDAVKNMLRKYL